MTAFTSTPAAARERMAVPSPVVVLHGRYEGRLELLLTTAADDDEGCSGGHGTGGDSDHITIRRIFFPWSQIKSEIFCMQTISRCKAVRIPTALHRKQSREHGEGTEHRMEAERKILIQYMYTPINTPKHSTERGRPHTSRRSSPVATTSHGLRGALPVFLQRIAGEDGRARGTGLLRGGERA